LRIRYARGYNDLAETAMTTGKWPDEALQISPSDSRKSRNRARTGGNYGITATTMEEIRHQAIMDERFC